MGRGKATEIGATYTSANGYHYTKTEKGWRLTHHLVAETKINRSLREDERVRFKNGNKTDLRPENIEIIEKGQGSIRRRKAVLEARIAELQAELDEINRELLNGRKISHSR